MLQETVKAKTYYFLQINYKYNILSAHFHMLQMGKST